MQNDEQLFKKFRGMAVNSGITTIDTGDFGLGQTWEEEYNQNWRIVEVMGKNTFLKIVPEHGDRIAINPYDRYVKCDGLIWKDKKKIKDKNKKHNIDPILICPTGDCPILTIYEKYSSLIAIVHSGRKGTSMGIVPQVINLIKDKYYIPPQDLEFGLWPGICQNCYEVEEELTSFFPPECVKVNNGKAYPDLKRVILLQLSTQDVPEDNISILNYCSRHSLEKGKPLFYSFRETATSKRNVVFISK